MKKRGTLPCQWQDNGHGSSYTCLVVEDPSNKLRYVMHRFDVSAWSEETVTNVTKYYSSLVERNSSSPVWTSALRILNSARQSHYFNVVGEFARLGSFTSFLSACMADGGGRPRRVGSVSAGFGRWMTKLATSLSLMHELGVVHGDVRLTSLFIKNSDASVVSGEDPDIGDLEALLLGAPMPFAHPFIITHAAAASVVGDDSGSKQKRQRKPATMPPPQEDNTPESYAAIPPVHDSLLPLMKLGVFPPELMNANNNNNQVQTKPSTTACDVFQFGTLILSLVVALRLFLHGKQNPSLSMNRNSYSSIEGLMKMFAANTTNNRLRKLVSSMLSVDPNMRPSMQKVLKEIASLTPAELNDIFVDFTPSAVAVSNEPIHHQQQQQPSAIHPESLDHTKINSSQNIININNNNNQNKNRSIDDSINNSLNQNNNIDSSVASISKEQEVPQRQNNNNNNINNETNLIVTSPTAGTRNHTPTNKNRRTVAEARLKQRQQQQPGGSNENGTPTDDEAAASGNNNNLNKNPHEHNNPTSDESWLRDARERLQGLEQLKKEQDHASPTFLSRQQQMQREQQQQQQQQQASSSEHSFDHLNETPPPQPSKFSPPKPSMMLPQVIQPQPKPHSYPNSGRNVVQNNYNLHNNNINEGRESSTSPDPERPTPAHNSHNANVNPHVKSPIQQQYKNIIHHAHHFNSNVKKVERPATAGVGGANAIGGGGGGGGIHLHELRNMKKHERNALLQKQDKEQEEKRQAFLEMKAEKQRKQEEDKKAFLERQRTHAAQMKQIKQAKRGIVEAVLANVNNNDAQDQNSNNNNHHQHHHHLLQHNNNNEIQQPQASDDVQIFVKRSGVVMRCDDATGFVPMTEDEKNNSPVLANRKRNSIGSGSEPKHHQNKQFHPQIHHHHQEDDENEDMSGTRSGRDENGPGSVRMKMDSSINFGGINNNNNKLLSTGTTDDGYTGDQNKLNDEILDGDDADEEQMFQQQQQSLNLASPSAMSTMHMSQKPGLAGRDRNIANNVSNDDDVVILVPSSTSNNNKNRDMSPIPVAPSHHIQTQQQFHPNLQQKHSDTLASLISLLGEEAVRPMMAEVDVFSKAPPPVRAHPRANAVFATRIRNIVESQLVPKLTHAFGVPTEEEGFMALLVMLGQVLSMKSASQSQQQQQQHYHHQSSGGFLPHQTRTLSEEFEL